MTERMAIVVEAACLQPGDVVSGISLFMHFKTRLRFVCRLNVCNAFTGKNATAAKLPPELSVSSLF